MFAILFVQMVRLNEEWINNSQSQAGDVKLLK